MAKKKIAAAPDSLLGYLQQNPPMRRCWLSDLSDEDREKMCGVKEAYQAGRYKGHSFSQMATAIKKHFGIKVTRQALNRFLTDNPNA